MGLIPKINAAKSAGILAGAVAADMASNKVLQNQNDWIKHGAPFAAGFFANKIFNGLGDGMQAVSGLALLKTLMPNMIGGDVMLQGTDFSDYSSSSYDTDASETGEMNY